MINKSPSIRVGQHAAIICFAALTFGCNDKQQEEEQVTVQASEYESSIFRSVLDKKPRMLSITLDEDVKIAYDTSRASMVKIWQGELELSGAVFDSRHGPQPESKGSLYYEAKSDYESGLSYVGYEIDPATGDGTLLFSANSHPSASISLRIQASTNDKNLNVIKTYQVTGVSSDKPLLINAPWLNSISKLSGSGEKVSASDNQTSLRLVAGETTISSSFALPETSAFAGEAAAEHPGLTLISNSDCVACHNAQKKTVGPSYYSIANRYANTPETKSMLANKIIVGGAGNWGQVPMNAHPNLTVDDANTMLDYIFTLQTNEQVELNPLMLNQPAVDIPFSVDEIQHSEDVNGAYAYLAKWPLNQEATLESILATPARMVALAPQIHLPNADAFSPYRQDLSLRIRSNLVLENDTKTTLRLVSDDGSYLFLDGEMIIDNWGFHGDMALDAEIDLPAGLYPFEIVYMQGRGGASLSFQWLNPQTGQFELVPESMMKVTASSVASVAIHDERAMRAIPGDQREVAGVHPSFDISQARPEEFKPMVGGIDFLEDGSMVVSTWDTEGSVYIVENLRDDADNIVYKRIAKGLAEPLGIKVVDGDIYVMQKQELTRLVDTNGDRLIDRYELVSNAWEATANFHEFAFGLEYEDGYFYATLATAIEPGGASTQPQAQDRGKALKISKQSGAVEFIAQGLRTPNGIGKGVDGEMFIADNQGDWLPASKIVELTKGAFYGARSVDYEGTKDLTETKPVVWLPQNEIGNSPSQPAPLNIGPYQNQMIHGEVTHGGLKRVFAERVNGRLQGAVFRFSQGLEAGVNRIAWASDKELIVGGVGSAGNWGHSGKAWYGLQRLAYNGKTAFEMLSVSARSNGFVVTFTEAIAEGQNISADDFEVIQWRYEPNADYGGPKLDETPLVPSAFSLSDDRTQVHFVLEGLKPDHVVYFRIKQPFASENNNELWTTETWYTLNAIPENKPVALNGNYSAKHNQLSEKETSEGWELLFDGKSLSGFRNYNQQSLGKSWVIDDGAFHLSVLEKADGQWQTEDGGDVVITPRPMENYELYLEWKIQPNGNSGIIYNVKESEALQYPFLSGPEFQILDNLGHSDGKIVTHRAGDNYDLVESRIVSVNPPGAWNRARLIVNNNKVEHWLNGYKVIDTEMFTPEWNALIAKSKFADWQDFAKSPGGHIVLQDHGDKVWFRNIKIKSLN